VTSSLVIALVCLKGGAARLFIRRCPDSCNTVQELAYIDAYKPALSSMNTATLDEFIAIFSLLAEMSLSCAGRSGLRSALHHCSPPRYSCTTLASLGIKPSTSIPPSLTS
jgi:hypothetical protein